MIRRSLRRAGRRPLLLPVALAAALLLVGAADAAPPPSRYPLDLSTAIGRAYPGGLAGIDRACTVWLSGGREQYALAAVRLRNGRSDTAGFQFVNTAGWFNMWRLHAAAPGVPAGQRATVKRLVGQLARRCGARWSP